MPNHISDTTAYGPVSVGIVEDDLLFRTTVAKLLEAEADTTCSLSVESCEEAIAAMEQSTTPQVMLMDISLPGMSGIEGIRRVKALSPTTEIVMLTVHEDNDLIFEAICAGATGYLLKPSSRERIVGAVLAARSGGAPINPHIAGKVLEMFSQLAVPRGDYGLTNREQEVLQHLVGQETKKEIAEALYLSHHTIDMHIRNIYAKLQVHSRSGAVAKAVQERLVYASGHSPARK